MTRHSQTEADRSRQKQTEADRQTGRQAESVARAPGSEACTALPLLACRTTCTPPHPASALAPFSLPRLLPHFPVFCARGDGCVAL
eukprot:495826-Rhodomonas_salina.1